MEFVDNTTCLPALLFPVTSIGSIGDGQKVAEIGITRLTWTWRDGCVRLFFDISSDAPASLYAQVKARV